MSDGSIGIRTYRDDETKIKLVDGASGVAATNALSIAKQGDTIAGGTNDFGIPVFGKDASGNYQLLEFTANGLAVDPGTVTVTATDLDIRDLDAAQDNVAISDGTNTLVVNADGSLNITDNAGSLTVDATDLDIRDLTHVSDSVGIGDGTNLVAVTASNQLSVKDDDLDQATDSVAIGDGTNLVAVSASGELSTEITNAQAAVGATAPTDLVQVGGVDPSGNAKTFAVNTDGSINAVVVDNPDEVQLILYNDFGGDGIANGVTETYDYVITDTKTFIGEKLLVGADGKILVEIGFWDGVSAYTPKLAYFQQPGQNHDHDIGNLILLGDGTVGIRVRVTGKSGQSSAVYMTLQGIEK